MRGKVCKEEWSSRYDKQGEVQVAELTRNKNKHVGTCVRSIGNQLLNFFLAATGIAFEACSVKFLTMGLKNDFGESD